MKHTAVALSLSLVSLATLESSAQAAPSAETAAVTGNTAFARDLYVRLSAQKDNLFFSPASISAALAMTHAGARGDTAKQMTKTLHFADVPANDLHAAQGGLLARLSLSGPDVPQLAIANRLWSQKGMALGADFTKLTKTHYGADVELLDFSGAPDPSRLAINNWVASKTNDKIRDLLAPGVINSDTRMVLTNAIWFKGKWATAFDKSATKNAPFAAPGGAKSVPTMHGTMSARYGETADAQIAELPYLSKDANRQMSLVIMLPKAKDGLAKLEADPKLDAWVAALYPAKVAISLPRFKTTADLSLGDTLSAMGMPDAFLAGKANFKGISEKESLYISKVIHKAFVDVNEEGTEAAAATAVVIATESAAVEVVKKLDVDHPFTFFIRDNKTGSVLFLGRINDPTK